jgi:hypothetical protein
MGGQHQCLSGVPRPERRYERLDIPRRLCGITNAQRAALLALGARERQT